MSEGPYYLTEDQLHRLHRARHSIQVMAEMLTDSGADPHFYHRVSSILELTGDDLLALADTIERTYRD